jgi:hypothetical protein
MTTIYVNAYPKAGSSWVCRLLGDVLDSPVGATWAPSNDRAIATEGNDRQGGHYIRQGHPRPIESEEDGVGISPYEIAYKNITTEKIVVVVRDPRDICVSGAYHWERDFKTFIHCVGRGEWPMSRVGDLESWVYTWMEAGLADCVTRYEWLLADAETELLRILDGIDIRPVRSIRKAVERQSFARRKEWTKRHGHTLNYGQDFQLRFLRKGIVGDWKNHFGPEEIELCEHYFGELMDDLGYVDQR